MKGIRFYQEFENRSKTRPTGNVFAGFVCNGLRSQNGQVMLDGLGAMYESPNSPVASTAASQDYLRTKCKRVPEAKARLIHPRLFERLDQAD